MIYTVKVIWNYIFVDSWSHHDNNVFQRYGKLAEGLQLQMKSQVFDLPEVISIPSFLSGLVLACDKNAAHELAAI